MEDGNNINAPPPSRQQIDIGWIDAVKSSIVPLADPKAFLLFIFAVLALITLGDYLKDNRSTNSLNEFMMKVESDRVAETQSQHDIMVQLLNIINNMNTLPNQPRFSISPPVGKQP